MTLDFRKNKVSRFYTFLDFSDKINTRETYFSWSARKNKSTQKILTLSSYKIVTLENLVA